MTKQLMSYHEFGDYITEKKFEERVMNNEKLLTIAPDKLKATLDNE